MAVLAIREDGHETNNYLTSYLIISDLIYITYLVREKLLSGMIHN